MGEHSGDNKNPPFATRHIACTSVTTLSNFIAMRQNFGQDPKLATDWNGQKDPFLAKFPLKMETFTSWEHCQVLPPYCMTIFCVIKSNIYWREREGRRNPRRQFFFLAMSRDHLQWESSSIALTHYQKKKNDERGERKHSAEKPKNYSHLKNFPWNQFTPCF